MGLVWIGQKGSYTGGIRFSISDFFHNKTKILLLAVAIFGCILLYLDWIKAKDISRILHRSLPVVLIFSYLAVFFSWNLVGYLISLIAPVVGVLVAHWIFQWAKKYKTVFVILFLISSFGISTWRSDLYFQKLADIRNLILDPTFSKILKDTPPLYINCMEGVFSFKFFTTRLLGQTLHMEELNTRKEKMFFVIHESKLCPAPQYIALAPKKIILSPSGSKSFELWQVELP